MNKAKKLPLTILLLSFILTGAGCATTKKTVSLGAIAGMTVGVTTGAIIAQHRQTEAALTLGVIAALVGATSGFFIHREFESERDRIRRQTLLNLEQYGFKGDLQSDQIPSVAPPEVEEYEVEAKVDGKKLIGPHKVWMIRKEAQWKLSNPPKDNQEEQSRSEVSND